MFGFSELPRVSAFVPRRASTRTALAVAAVCAAFFAVANSAHAEDCLGGYRMVKEIPVICQDTAGSRALFSAGQAEPREPLYTGSINRIEQPADATRPSASPTAAPAPASTSSNAAAACDHGMRFVETPNNGATLMIKCS